MTSRGLTVLSAFIAAAGLSSSLLAQGVETRLVFDNDPMLASIGVNYGGAARLPGAGATAIGITLMARATTVFTNANFGIATMGGSSAAGNSIFYHDDGLSNQTTTLWTSPALAFQRGVSGPGAERGLMSYTDLGAAPHNFRSLIPGGSPAANSNSANASNPQPENSPYDSHTNGLGSHANGWIGVPAGPGFPSPAGSGVVLAATAQYAQLPDVNGTSPFINYGVNDQDQATDGNQSPWVALYHVLFVPRDVEGQREITVSFSGAFRYGISTQLFPGGWGLTLSPLWTSTASATFTVPAPGAAALLVLPLSAGAMRRRRR